MTPLEKFGRWCLTELRGDGIDYCAARDKAIELGLLGYVTVTEPCGENCDGEEWCVAFPIECLRETPLAKGDER